MESHSTEGHPGPQTVPSYNSVDSQKVASLGPNHMVRAQFQELKVVDKVAGRDRTSPSGLVKATLYRMGKG